MSKKLPAPSGLSKRSAARWREITERWVLRPDELRVLEDACREMDIIDALEEALETMPLLIEGSMGQKVINPAVQEVRQHRAILTSLWKTLKLPDEDGEREQAAAESRSAAARHAAKSRWEVHHGAA